MSKPSEDRGALVSDSQLCKARRFLELTPEEVAEELHVAVGDLHGWERGDSEPSLKQLEGLAQLYGREIDYFLADTPEPPERIRFRTAPGQALTHLSKDARVILARFEELCRCAWELEGLLGKKRGCKILRLALSMSPQKGAADLRQKLGVKDGPMPNLKDLLDGVGVGVFELPVPGNEFSGFSFWHRDYGPCILVNADDPKGRRNFTIAHEVAHLLYGHGSSVCYVPPEVGRERGHFEVEANKFAVELLLPELRVSEDFMKRGCSGTPSPGELGPMSYRWGVSVQALGYRLEGLGLVQKGHTHTLLELKPPHVRASRTPRWERGLARSFVETAFEAYDKKLVSIGKLAHSLQIPIRQAVEEVDRRSK